MFTPSIFTSCKLRPNNAIFIQKIPEKNVTHYTVDVLNNLLPFFENIKSAIYIYILSTFIEYLVTI